MNSGSGRQDRGWDQATGGRDRTVEIADQRNGQLRSQDGRTAGYSYTLNK
jgi:hypothetical protein